MTNSNQPQFRNIDLRAVAIGVLATMAFRKLLMLLGGGLGIWSLQAGRVSPAFFLWSLVALTISQFLAGYLAAATGPNASERESALLGFTIWASVLAVRIIFLSLNTRGFSVFFVSGGTLAPRLALTFVGELVALCLAMLGAIQGRRHGHSRRGGKTW